jgi:hypothetical protein
VEKTMPDAVSEALALELFEAWRSAERAAIAAELAAGVAERVAGSAERAAVIAETRADEALRTLVLAEDRYRRCMAQLERNRP